MDRQLAVDDSTHANGLGVERCVEENETKASETHRNGRIERYRDRESVILQAFVAVAKPGCIDED